MRRVLVLFLTLLLLWMAVAQVNDLLAPAHVSVFAGGLFVAYAALFLPLGEGLPASLLAGAVCDAHAPVRFGTFVLLFAIVHVLLFAWRDRLPHDQPAGRLGLVLLANLALFLALSGLASGPLPAHAGRWPRLAADLAVSELFVALVFAWFFALQERALALLPPDPERLF
jgi:rod shape-determining protein MreD